MAATSPSVLDRTLESEAPAQALPETLPASLAEIVGAPLEIASWDLLADRFCALRLALADRSSEQLDQQLRLCARRHGAFLLRGLLAIVRTERIHKLVGGRGHKDAEGVGRGMTLKALASRIGMAYPTLKQDVQIVKTLFLDWEPQSGPTSKTRIALDPTLPRRWFLTVLPLKAYAWQALDLACSKRLQATRQQPYTLAQFQKDVQALFPSVAPLPEPKWTPHLALAEATQTTAEHFAAVWHTTPSGALDRMVAEFAFHHPIA